ncbi:sialidase family protein [candidate division KSB1 bacterium]
MRSICYLIIAIGVLAGTLTYGQAAKITSLRLDNSRPGRYARSFQAPDGTIHLLGLFKIIDQGSRVVFRNESDPPWGTTDLNESHINTFFSRPGLFIGLLNKVKPISTGIFEGRIWRSSDNLKTLREEATTVIIPEAGEVDFGDAQLWAGLFFHRAVVELSDGSLLAAMYGNFEEDSSPPTHPWSKTESKYKLRAFAVRSTDDGKSWQYLASVAVPDRSRPDDSEGFNEWSIVRLDDGRLLGVIRTGHFTPLVVCWSEDEGRTWTDPKTIPDLGLAGCDPFLLKLSDGRLALAYGEMVQPPPPPDRARYWAEFETSGDRRRRCRLAISRDETGERWTTMNISEYANRSAYPTIFEVEPNTILYQADLELWRVEIPQ